MKSPDDDDTGGLTMGLDVLDMLARLERRFGIRFSNREFSRLIEARSPPDASVRELAALIRHKLGPAHPLVSASSDLDRACVSCGYNLRGLDPLQPNHCPECGVPGDPQGQLLLTVQKVIADAIGKQPEQINPDALLIRDLDLS